MERDKAKLLAECRRLENNSLWTASAHYTAASWTGRFHLFCGSIPIVLGGVGGWDLLHHPNTADVSQIFIAGLFTLTAGIVGSLITFWDLAKTQLDHFKAAGEYKTLENEARRAYEIHGGDESYAEFKARVLDLASRYDKLGKDSIQSKDLMFWLAGKKVRKGIYEPEGKE